MMKNTGIPNGLSGVGLTMDDVSALTAKAMPQRRLLDNSPRPVDSEETLAALFRDAITYW